uniref:Uncharacterized protein n=1 Tax=Triticum urartu TaxID=4572 RepID=A0A8R7PT84_TRIUA
MKVLCTLLLASVLLKINESFLSSLLFVKNVLTQELPPLRPKDQLVLISEIDVISVKFSYAHKFQLIA